MVTRSHTAQPATEGPRGGSLDVRVEGIRKTFASGAQAALGGVDLQVRPGELLALLGPSGSGKTTLLRVIAGLDAPDAGRVLFGGEDVTARPVQDRGIGFVFQHYALFRHMSVADNIAYGLRVSRRGRSPAAAIRARVDDLLGLVQLEGLGARFPAQLSGGQRQRVALARALATEPRLLLLDEPFGALDAQVRKDLRRWLRDIHRRTGQTTVFVTHDQDEALELADRVAILHGGRLEQVGEPDEIYDQPASSFVMSFIGESVRLPVAVEGGRVLFGGRTLDAVAAPPILAGRAQLFLRPGELAVAADGTGDLVGTVRAIRRGAAGRRADVRIDPDGIDSDGLDLELELGGREVAVGDRLALAVTGGRVFPDD